MFVDTVRAQRNSVVAGSQQEANPDNGPHLAHPVQHRVVGRLAEVIPPPRIKFEGRFVQQYDYVDLWDLECRKASRPLFRTIVSLIVGTKREGRSKRIRVQ